MRHVKLLPGEDHDADALRELHGYKAGKLDQQTFRAWMTPVQVQIEALLGKAVAADIERLSGAAPLGVAPLVGRRLGVGPLGCWGVSGQV
ncbi:MAG: hypothetical protein MJE77_20000 [Proteobacteria bacterium]|nr:hypothetical protein [Pseudomonadota bacterium]